ncbi:MAG: hypothetical protein ACRC6T_03690 [Sarcina sp.]
MEEFKYIYESKIGKLLIVASESSLLEINHCSDVDEKLKQNKNKIIDETIRQLEEYFNGATK